MTLRPGSIWWRRARLISVTDGDTVRLELDLGYRVYTEQGIRLVGVNAPEMNTEEGKAARFWVGQWFMAHGVHAKRERWPFLLHSARDGQSFSRYVGAIYCGEGHSLGDDLVAAEHAVWA
jgi:endonuclease YncB( thermonuclease family)